MVPGDDWSRGQVRWVWTGYRLDRCIVVLVCVGQGWFVGRCLIKMDCCYCCMCLIFPMVMMIERVCKIFCSQWDLQ